MPSGMARGTWLSERNARDREILSMLDQNHVGLCPPSTFHISIILGSRQVVRHMVLVHAFGGSNPSSPAI